MRASCAALLLGFLLMARLPASSGLYCYVCPEEEPSCQDPFDETQSLVQDCDDIQRRHVGGETAALVEDNTDLSLIEPICIKVTVEGYNAANNTVIRGCSYEIKNMCDVIAAAVDLKSDQRQWVTSCTTCNWDTCNAAVVLATSRGRFLAGIALIIAAYRWH